MSEGFLGRWSRRKEAVRKGEELAPEAPLTVPAPQPSPQPSPASGRGSLETPSSLLPQGSPEAVPPSPLRGEGRGERAAAATPPPTLEDAQALTRDSDFTRFAKPDVAPEVKNAAFKKLFSDPHFNVMDGLDVYIDDYGKPDPLPPGMLRQLASAKYLKLFDDEEEAEKKTKDPREVADQPEAGIVAESGSPTAPASPPAEDHADPDLRLQQDDAPGCPGPGEESR